MKDNLLSLFTITKMCWVLLGSISTLPPPALMLNGVTSKCQIMCMYICVYIRVCVCVCSFLVTWGEEIFWQVVLQNYISSIMPSQILEGFISILRSMHWMDTFKFLTDRPGELELTHSVFACDMTSVRNSPSRFFCQQYAGSSFYKVQAQLQIQVQAAFSPWAKPSSQNNSHRLAAWSLNMNPAWPMVTVVVDKSNFATFTFLSNLPDLKKALWKQTANSGKLSFQIPRLFCTSLQTN